MSPNRPPRNKSIKFRMKGETNFTTGTTSKSQPKPSSINRGFVNFIEEGESKAYSIKWVEVEEWNILEGTVKGKKKNQEPHKEKSESEKDKKTSESEASGNDDEQDKDSSEESESSRNGDKNTPDSQYRKTTQISSSSDDDFLREYDKEIPPYQPVTNPTPLSESVYSTASSMENNNYEERISQDLSGLSISVDSEKQSKKKRTPLRFKIQSLKEELQDEKEKSAHLESII